MLPIAVFRMILQVSLMSVKFAKKKKLSSCRILHSVCSSHKEVEMSHLSPLCENMFL